MAGKNWTGQKFNKLLFIESAHKRNNKIYWKLLCECENIIIAIPYDVYRGNTKSCGCLKPEQAKDWTNIKRGRLTFIRKISRTKRDQIIWEALCECGNITTTIPSNNALSCGCLSKEKSREKASIMGKAGRKYHPIISSARQVWNKYKKNGNIDFDTFFKLTQLPCNYCGSPPFNGFNSKNHPDGLFIYNGLDRVDSTKGHDINNIVPCCIDCNQSKNDKSVNDFFEHIKRIYNFLKLGDV